MEDAVVTDAVTAAAVVEVVVELDVDGSACFFLIVSSSRERIRAIKIYYCQQGHRRSDILATTLPWLVVVPLWAKIRRIKKQFMESACFARSTMS